MNYFFIKAPSDPPFPFLLFSIIDIRNSSEKIFRIGDFFEIDFCLKIFSYDYEFELLSEMIDLLIMTIDSLILFENSTQLSFKHYKTEVNFDSIESKKKKSFFEVSLFFKSWYFS